MVYATERSMEAPISTRVCPTATIPRATDLTMMFSMIKGLLKICPSAKTLSRIPLRRNTKIKK
jgi:hypothetical protein